jgi:hypothetical protein
MFQRIRTSVARYRLKQEVQKVHRERKLSNLASSRKIGILYTLNDVPDYDIVAEFVTRLQHDKKEVKALGFVRNKILVSRFLPKLAFDFFSGKDVSFFFRPTSPKVKDFMDQEFDLLLDLSLSENIPLKFIAGLSAAHCRVGMFTEEDFHCYDLMIDIPKGMGITDYISHITHYLTVINKDDKTA